MWEKEGSEADLLAHMSVWVFLGLIFSGRAPGMLGTRGERVRKRTDDHHQVILLSSGDALFFT